MLFIIQMTTTANATGICLRWDQDWRLHRKMWTALDEFNQAVKPLPTRYYEGSPKSKPRPAREASTTLPLEQAAYGGWTMMDKIWGEQRLYNLLLTSQLGIEAAQTDSKCLESGKRVPVVHCKHILPNLSKLQKYFVVVALRGRRWSFRWCH